MKNSIHEYYSHMHKSDPCLSFEDCLAGTAAQKKISFDWLLRGAVDAALLLGIALMPLMENYTNPGIADETQDTPLAAAQSQSGDTVSNEAEMRQPERNRTVDEEILPIATTSPEYPAEALEAGIEGWVLVSFTVTAAGEVADAIVADAEPLDIFDAAALQAIEQFQFNPRVVNGEAVAVEEVRYLFRFNP